MKKISIATDTEISVKNNSMTATSIGKEHNQSVQYEMNRNFVELLIITTEKSDILTRVEFVRNDFHLVPEANSYLTVVGY